MSYSYNKESFELLRDVMNAVREAKCIDFIKTFDSEKGFLFSKDPKLSIIKTYLKQSNHSPYSLAFTLRECQHFLNNPSEWKALEEQFA